MNIMDCALKITYPINEYNGLCSKNNLSNKCTTSSLGKSSHKAKGYKSYWKP